MQHRKAPFDIPYQLSGIYCEGALNQVEADGMVDQFPHDLLKRIQAGAGLFGDGCTITQTDVDGLSDTAWNYLKEKLSQA